MNRGSAVPAVRGAGEALPAGAVGCGGRDRGHDRFLFDDNMSLASISSSMFSSVRSHSTHIESEGYCPRSQLCLIGVVTPTLEAAAESFGLPVVRSATGAEYLDDPSVVLLADDFTPEVIDRMGKIKWRVIGSVAAVVCANEDRALPVAKRPIFNFSMNGVNTCFTGIRDRALAIELMFLIRSMGGSVREEPNASTTHLISRTTKGKKYEYARTFLVPVMSVDWVWKCWEKRFFSDVHATDDEMMAYRLKPFVEVRAAFVGFPSAELDDMVAALAMNGGQLVEASSPMCTHIVADDIAPVTIPANAWPEATLVRAEWFWTSIQQVVLAPEAEYPVSNGCFRRPPQRGSVRLQPQLRPHLKANKENLEPMEDSPESAASSSSPCCDGFSPFRGLRDRNARRLSLADVKTPDMFRSPNRTLTPGRGSPKGTPLGVMNKTLTLTPSSPTTPELYTGQTSPEPSAPAAGSPRGTPWRRPSSLPGTPTSQAPGPRSPVAAAAGTPPRPRPSLSGSGCTRTPGSRGTPTAARRLSIGRRGSLASVAATPISARFGAFLELMHTEQNYVGILDAILQMRSEALNTSQAGGSLLTQTEAKMIFGTLMPIARTHHAILRDLRVIYNNWGEAANIGEVYQKHSPDLLRDYMPFVSSFEDAKEALEQASERNPRFHAFLKVCRGKPECGRQELRELMIRPVQRLGSCVLLLREILKHTPEGSPDRKQLESALDSLSHVLSLINEDKRKMEGLCKVFDIYHLIEKCPADLIASHRSLIVECEGVEVSEHGFSKQGNYLAFFVFTDVIAVCKKRAKVVAMMKGRPGSAAIPQRVLKAVGGKPYKFLQILPLSTIKKIVDVSNSDSVTNAMGLVFRGKTEIRESCSYFRLADGGDALDKAQLIERWSCALASHNCVADPSKFVQRETAEEAGILSTSEVLAKQINRAAQMAVKTQVIMSSVLGRTLSTTSSRSGGPSPRDSPPACSSGGHGGPCVMSTFNSTSRLETMQDLQEQRQLGAHKDSRKSSSLNANIMKRM